MNRKLQQARFERHWSMVVAAQHVGVSRVTYMRWESGEQLPHETTLMLLCKAFKMSPAQLGFGHEKRSDKGQAGALTLPEAAIALDVPTVQDTSFSWEICMVCMHTDQPVTLLTYSIARTECKLETDQGEKRSWI